MPVLPKKKPWSALGCGTNAKERPGRPFAHVPVLRKEAVELLSLPEDGVAVDATAGLGGHAAEILKRIPRGRYIGIDRDADALQRLGATLGRDPRVTLLHANFADIPALAGKHGFSDAHGVLLDLGVSSLQLDDASRGFSFTHPGPLDMRMDRDPRIPTAADLVRSSTEEELADLLRRLGEEPKARRIARALVRARDAGRLRTTEDLAAAARSAYPGRSRRDPATRTFQALRMAVNRELEALEMALPGAVSVLRPGGRLVVIAFHSLEDRRVKDFFRRESRGCLCPPGMPECRCGHRASLRVLTRKPVTPGAREVAENPRARSAKLRAAEKI